MGNKMNAHRMSTVGQGYYILFYVILTKSFEVWTEEETFLFLSSLEVIEILRCQLTSSSLSG